MKPSEACQAKGGLLMIRFFPLALVVLALALAAFADKSHTPAVADHLPVVTGIDMDTAGNTATLLGPIDKCASLSVGSTLQVDIWATDFHELIGWQTSLYYDPQVIRVTAKDPNFFFTLPGSLLIDVSDLVPDNDGLYVPAFADLSTAPYGSGSGVMTRLTIEALAPGHSPIYPTGNYLLTVVAGNIVGIGDINGDDMFDGEIHGAIAWVGQPCPGGANDGDGDGIDDSIDNCDLTGNPDQADRDGDGIGNWCDDPDGDWLLDTVDTCPSTYGSGPDSDGDGFGDVCDPDKDGDGIPNASDNAASVPNPDQADSDGDSVPDVLDSDADGDGVQDKSNPTFLTVNIGGDPEPETVFPAALSCCLQELPSDSDSDIDEVYVPVMQLGGTLTTVDIDGDGEPEVAVKDPALPPGSLSSWDLNSQDPDIDKDVVRIGGGPLGALVPSGQDLDGDGEMEALVWEPALAEGVQQDLDVDGDGDVDVRWRNGQVPSFDNCPVMVNPSQANNDMDAYGDDCDTDDDNDGYLDTAETSIGTGGFSRCGTAGWPSDFVSGGTPDSTNRVNVLDLASFIAPERRINTSPGEDAGYNGRWDLVPGAGLFTKVVNVTDLTALLTGATGYPPMLAGARAFNGPPCP